MGFHHFAELHYRVTEVQHKKIKVVPGDLLTEAEVEALKADIRQGFDGSGTI